MAHQWFYSVVGNDQALDPFADEAVADFIARNLVNRFGIDNTRELLDALDAAAAIDKLTTDQLRRFGVFGDGLAQMGYPLG